MSGTTVVFSRDELDLIAALAGCSLDESPGKNWVENSGGLPEYICELARAIKKTGKSTSQAIAIAVSRVKMWATGKDVDAKTQAKATAAVAQWEKLKGKNKAKTTGKHAKTVAASAVLRLANSEYCMDIVSAAFDARTRQARTDWRASNPTADYDAPDCPSRFWVKEVWNTFLIVQSSYGRDADLFKVPYTVGESNDVTFAEPIEVKTQYVEVADDDDASGSDLSDAVLQKLLGLAANASPAALDKILTLSQPDPAALDRVLAAGG